MWQSVFLLGVFWLVPNTAGCNNTQDKTHKIGTVVVYCSVDTAFAEPILSDFEKSTGIKVHRQFDTEAGKTTGLVNKLLAERKSPRADVWWSSEIFGTLQLARKGIFAPYKPNTANDIPDQYRDADGLWTAFGLRGRVIAYDPERTRPKDLPKRWSDLTNPEYNGRFAMADPRFGTTRGHMATLLSLWGQEDMTKFYEGLRRNAFHRADGNSHAVLMLARGMVDFAATDTDDVIVAQRRGDSVAMIYPDMDSPDRKRLVSGTLWIPCSVAMVKNASHPDHARKLIDHLVSDLIEKKLYTSDSRNVPVRPALRVELGATAVGESSIDYSAAAAVLEQSDRLVTDVLLE